MVLPTQLSEPALAILRVFIQSNCRLSGTSLPLEDLDGLDPEASGPASGLAELADHGLVESLSHGGEPRAVLTETGQAFFERFYIACHG